MTQFTFTYEELLRVLTAYEIEAIALFPHNKKLIQMSVLATQDIMKSDLMLPFRDDQKQSSLPGFLQAPISLENGRTHTNPQFDHPAAAHTTSPKKLKYEATYFSKNSEPKTTIITALSQAAAEDIANEKCDVLAGEWSTVKCLDKPKRSLPVIQEKLDLK